MRCMTTCRMDGPAGGGITAGHYGRGAFLDQAADFARRRLVDHGPRGANGFLHDCAVCLSWSVVPELAHSSIGVPCCETAQPCHIILTRRLMARSVEFA